MINKSLIIEKLKNMQNGIIYESDEDEGAAEYYAEIQSVINAINDNKTDEQILEAANNVGIVL